MNSHKETHHEELNQSADAILTPAVDTTAAGDLPASRESGLPKVHGREVRRSEMPDRRVATGGVHCTGEPSISAPSTATAPSLEILDTIRAIADPEAVPFIPAGSLPL